MHAPGFAIPGEVRMYVQYDRHSGLTLFSCKVSFFLSTERGMFIAYGTKIDSVLDLPHIPSNSDRPTLTVTVHEGRLFDNLEEDRAVTYASQKRNIIVTWYRAEENKVRFLVEGVAGFDLDFGNNAVFYFLFHRDSGNLLRYWTLQHVLPLFLSGKGIYNFLHACSIEIDQKAIVFVGTSHSGKSTLADYFLRRGHALISDDHLGLFQEKSVYQATPSFPYARPFRDFENLGDYVSHFALSPKELGAIFTLSPSPADSEPEILRLPLKDALLTLLHHRSGVFLWVKES
ncbi:MAG: hypothetical protein WC291_07070, partial [Thermodesulfovibrionales bacterium]